ncbi:MAG: protein phosphatase [Actinobacteria bacterium HGW-Actinobacteria-7]|jgi:protein phosphatase|nr:MAG: protein phosphatase [Actinobacteria bacterium HGW-Actinobacteria-7]
MTPRSKQTWASLSDIGRVRTHNEDSVIAQPPLFAVADGLGGHEAGEVASAIAVETLRDHAPRRADANALARAVRAANSAVMRAAREGVGRSGMGTTMTAALVDGGHIVLAHVGDSRAYLLRGAVLEPLTDDHSMVADMIRRGQLSEADARVHPNRSVITRALGTDSNMVADTYEVHASAGDRLLLCSDGLSGMLTDERITELLGAYRDPSTAAHALVDAANEAGGQDNVSVIVVDIEETSDGVHGEREGDRRLRGSISVVLWILAFLVVVAGIGYGTYRYARSRAYLIAENGVVSVYQGVPGEVAGVSLNWPVRKTTVAVDALPPAVQARLADGETVSGLPEALRLAESYQQMAIPSPDTTLTP